MQNSQEGFTNCLASEVYYMMLCFPFSLKYGTDINDWDIKVVLCQGFLSVHEACGLLLNDGLKGGSLRKPAKGFLLCLGAF